jgi:hypothetical protein
MPLQVREPHLDLLAFMPRLLEALGTSERPGNVPGMLMDVTRDLARWFLWAALRFEWADIAVALACAIQKRLALVHGAARPKLRIRYFNRLLTVCSYRRIRRFGLL